MAKRKVFLITAVFVLTGLFLTFAIFTYSSLFDTYLKNPEYTQSMGLYFSVFFFLFLSPAILMPAILSSSFFSMEKRVIQVPFGLRYTRAVNLTLLLIVGGIFLAAAIVPAYLRFVQKPNHLLNASAVATIILGVGAVLAQLITILNRDLLLAKPKARRGQIFIGLILLAFFPFGTIFYAVVLYFMLFDQKTKRFFQHP